MESKTLNTRTSFQSPRAIKDHVVQKKSKETIIWHQMFLSITIGSTSPAQHLGSLGGDNTRAVTKGWHNSALRLWGRQIYGMRCNMSGEQWMHTVWSLSSGWGHSAGTCRELLCSPLIKTKWHNALSELSQCEQHFCMITHRLHYCFILFN